MHSHSLDQHVLQLKELHYLSIVRLESPGLSLEELVDLSALLGCKKTQLRSRLFCQRGLLFLGEHKDNRWEFLLCIESSQQLHEFL